MQSQKKEPAAGPSGPYRQLVHRFSAPADSRQSFENLPEGYRHDLNRKLIQVTGLAEKLFSGSPVCETSEN
ncbi:MAG: hypothetical protein ABFD64_11160 [Armatimonadota bacterium]